MSDSSVPVAVPVAVPTAATTAPVAATSGLDQKSAAVAVLSASAAIGDATGATAAGPVRHSGGGLLPRAGTHGEKVDAAVIKFDKLRAELAAAIEKRAAADAFRIYEELGHALVAVFELNDLNAALKRLPESLTTKLIERMNAGAVRSRCEERWKFILRIKYPNNPNKHYKPKPDTAATGTAAAPATSTATAAAPSTTTNAATNAPNSTPASAASTITTATAKPAAS